MNVLVTGVGGPTPRSFVRAVKCSGRESLKNVRFIGVDCNPLAYGLYDRALFDRSFLVPRADHPNYWDQINDLIKQEDIEIAVVLPELEVLAWAENLDKLCQPILTHLPDPKLVEALIDKHRLHVELADTQLIPKFVKVDPTSFSYEQIIKQVGTDFWIRATVGSSGFGSLQISSSEMLDNWLAINSTIEEFIATEFLPGRNLACKLLYFQGQLKRTACAERVHYIMAKVAPSGITGNTSFGRLLNYPELVQISEDTMCQITQKIGVMANGIFTLDYKEDRHGVPKLTEINVRHVAFNSSIAAGGANLPADTLEGLMLDDPTKLERVDYQFPQPLIFLRDVDGEPIVMRESDLLGQDDWSADKNRAYLPLNNGFQAPNHSLLANLNAVLATSRRPGLQSVSPQQRLQEDLGLDSLELAELSVRLEAETGVDVFRDGLVSTVGDVIQRLEARS